MNLLFENASILAWKNNGFCYIPKGFLTVLDDTIGYIGTEKPAGKFDDIRDMRGKLLMPGLINCHSHAAMALLRGVGSDLPLDKWLFDNIFPIEDRLTVEDISAGTELAMMEMIASGTTSFTDMYMEPLTAVKLNEHVAMKESVCRVMQSFDPNETIETTPRTAEAIDLFESCHNTQNGRVRIDFSVHAEYTIHDAVAGGFGRILKPYISRGARMHIHLSETEKEHRECIQRHGLTPAAWFEKMGLLDLPTTAAHCVWAEKQDLAIFKRLGVSPVHNPTSNMKLGSGFAPIPEMLDMGLNVCLGTDGAASNNNLNMFEEMHLAAVIHNGYRKDAVLMRPDQVLRMATVNGARAQGRPDTGRLEAGAKADIIALDWRKCHLIPMLDPMAALVYSAQGSDVVMTMVDGKILYEDGKFLTLDPEKVIFNAEAASKRLTEE